MKKLIKLEFNNTTRERKTEDSYSELYSYDKNNGSFEFEILNDTLTTEQVTALFKFTDSNKIWKTTGTVEGNKVNVTFDTSLITQNETVICYLYFDEEQRTSDTFRFKFKVKVSEIDKMNRYEIKERFINNTVIVDRLDVVTKDELKEALKNVGGIATEGLLTEVKAEELYAKKTDAVDNTNFELVKNRVLALELKTDKDTVYDDSEVKERLTTLENKAPVDLSGYATKEELRNVSGSQPLADNLVTKQELEEKQYLTTHQDLSEYAKKSELYNDSDLKARVEVLEQKTDKDTVYDDTPLKERVTALESRAIEGGTYDDKPIRDRLDVLEAKHDNDTIYDDTEVKRRLTEIESKPAIDTSVFVTNEFLESELEQLAASATKPIYIPYYNDTAKNFLDNTTIQNEKTFPDKRAGKILANVDKKNLENIQIFKGDANNSQFVDFDAAMYSLANSLPDGYNLNSVRDDINNKVIFLSNKNFVEAVPKEELKAIIREVGGTESTGSNIDTSNLATKEELVKAVTKEELETKHYVTEEELNNKAYLTQQNLDNYALKSELPTPYNDSTLNERVTALESKAIEGGAYDDTDLRNRVINLENKPPLDTSEFVTNQALESRGYINDVSNFVTKEELTNKGYLTTHQSLDNVVTKEELATKGYITDVSNLVTKEELESKNYLTTPYNDTSLKERVEALETKTDNIIVYDDTDLKTRVEALENKSTTGGTQTQDTGWIKISDDDSLHGNVVKIRRINDMVHVSLSNPNSEGLQFELDSEAFTVILASKKIGIGFTPLKTITVPVTETENVMRRISDGTNVIGQVVYRVESGKVIINSFGTKFSFGQPLEVLVNDFSYFTEDPFPVELQK